MAEFKEGSSLQELQVYIAEVCRERGWDQDSPERKFLLFVEEVGELAKAMRKAEGLYAEQSRQRDMPLEEEFADVLSYLLDLANVYGVDLESAFREKEAINRGRTWE